MTDWNRDGHTDAADIATEYAAYRAIMGEDNKPRRSTRGSSTGSGAGAAWAIIAAAVLALLTLCSR